MEHLNTFRQKKELVYENVMLFYPRRNQIQNLKLKRGFAAAANGLIVPKPQLEFWEAESSSAENTFQLVETADVLLLNCWKQSF